MQCDEHAAPVDDDVGSRTSAGEMHFWSFVLMRCSARVSRECVKICHLVVHTVALDTCGSSSAPNHQQQ